MKKKSTLTSSTRNFIMESLKAQGIPSVDMTAQRLGKASVMPFNRPVTDTKEETKD